MLHLPYDEFLDIQLQQNQKFYRGDPIDAGEPNKLIVLFLFTVATIAAWLNEMGFSAYIGRYQFEEIYVHELNPWINFLTAMGLRVKLPANADEIIRSLLIRRLNAHACKHKAKKRLYRNLVQEDCIFDVGCKAFLEHFGLSLQKDLYSMGPDFRTVILLELSNPSSVRESIEATDKAIMEEENASPTSATKPILKKQQRTTPV